VQPSDVDAFVKAAILRCRERAGMKHEVLASLMGISASQLSQQLLPGGHVSMSRLLLAAKDADGAKFLEMLWHEIAEHLGIGELDAVAAELKRFQGRINWLANRIQVRMVRAELRQVEKDRDVA
jgi:hypothetical protein